MKYIIAFDGGGTKTHMAVLSIEGEFLYEEIGPGCNHSSIGGNEFVKVIKNLYQKALSVLKIDEEDIELGYLGLSGADLESDFKLLNEACKQIFKTVSFKVVNDAWIVMRSGLESPYGAVAISGTGTNSAAINKSGKRAILRSLGYTLGIYGGGLDIAREALHYAFRADELTYIDTMLRTEIPKLFNLKQMEDVVKLFYPINIVDRFQFGEITKLVNDCAILNDEVSQDILKRAGSTIGLQTIGVIKQVGMDEEIVPVVVGGKVFSGESPLLLEEFTKSILMHCKKAYIVLPKYKPVFGAYLAALDELDIKQESKHTKSLK